MPQYKPITEIKQIFDGVTNKLQKKIKMNAEEYRQKYYQLSHVLNVLYKDMKKCHQRITDKSIKEENEYSEHQMHIMSQLKTDECHFQPIAIVEHIHKLCQRIICFCGQLAQKQRALKDEIGCIVEMENQADFMRILAKKQLANYELILKVQELQSSLAAKVLECQLAEKTTREYQKKFGEYEKDYKNILISVADLLKQNENCEIELRQENRLQKQLLQSSKIQFQKYKSAFKIKAFTGQRIKKYQQILDKKYQQKEGNLIKHTEKIVEQRLKDKKNIRN